MPGSDNLVQIPSKDPKARQIAWLALVICLGLRAADYAPALVAWLANLF